LDQVLPEVSSAGLACLPDADLDGGAVAQVVVELDPEAGGLAELSAGGHSEPRV